MSSSFYTKRVLTAYVTIALSHIPVPVLRFVSLFPGSKGVIPLNDRLAVAEFGLLESQMSSINGLDIGSLDDDVLQVLVDQVVDFKRRLGIDYYVQGVNFNLDSIRTWFNELGETTKEGLTFYAKGLRLLYNDLKYAFSLFSKAITGYTLKPREVRTLRRTFKDVLTFIPFIIILIIPLTPVGHVFVFGAIQRFFPDFFPTCFTERRQNLLQLFEQSEFKKIDIDENFIQQVNRAVIGLATLIAVRIKETVLGVVGGSDGGGDGRRVQEGGGDAGREAGKGDCGKDK